MTPRLKKLVRSWRTWVVAAAVVAIVLLLLGQLRPQPKDVPLDTFTKSVAAGRVATAEIQSTPSQVVGELTDGTKYVTAFPPAYAERLTTQLLRAEVDLSADNGANSTLTDLLVNLVPTVLVIGVFLWFAMQMQGGGRANRFGRAKARMAGQDDKVTFVDVAGADEAVMELGEIVEFLKDPSRFTQLGARIPKGVLLSGPPGTGKTLLARAVAGEADVPFLTISGSDFVEMFVGVGASRVRDLFKQARESSPCIIFLDEIDAVGRRRGSGMGGGNDEREQTLNAILVEMDGFGTDEGIIVIAATNRPDVLDPALLRPGRFDREVTIELPDLKGREQILKVHLKKVKVGGDVDVATLARSTPGYSGADLAAIINEAAIMAALAKKEEVSMEHLEEARDKVRYGRQKKSRNIEELDRKITAIHEAGHAVVAAVIPEVDDPHKVTIVPRGRALGSTMVLPEKESYHMQKKKMVGTLAVLFGGRVAEELYCGDISAGASDDIRRATEMARAMVTELGMSEKVGPINYAERQGSEFLGTELMGAKWHSEETAREIDTEIQRLLRDALEEARSILGQHGATIERITQTLLRYETITGDEIKRLIAGEEVVRPEPPATPPPPPLRPLREGRADAGSESTEGLGNAGLSPA
jgi:cell division protease FtsH